jgi:hypothetical protein
MRVPSIGLPLDERLIVREGYRLAEHLLRDYRDPPRGLAAAIGTWLAYCRQSLLGTATGR